MNVLTKIEDLSNDFEEFEIKYVSPDGKNLSFFTDNRQEAERFIEFGGFVEPAPVNEFQTICNSLAEVLTAKNIRYGNSALNPIEVFNGKTKVGQRADDKLSRIKFSDTLRKNDVCDLIGYLILICKENDWKDFTDQID